MVTVTLFPITVASTRSPTKSIDSVVVVSETPSFFVSIGLLSPMIVYVVTSSLPTTATTDVTVIFAPA